MTNQPKQLSDCPKCGRPLTKTENWLVCAECFIKINPFSEPPKEEYSTMNFPNLDISEKGTLTKEKLMKDCNHEQKYWVDNKFGGYCAECRWGNPEPPKEEECDCWSVHENLNLTKDTCGCSCHNPPEKSGWEEEFDERFVREGIIRAAGTPVKSFIHTELQKARKETIRELDKKYNSLCEEKVREERERCIEVVENGGTGDTILEITHNGEKFVNVRQLIKALKNQKDE